MFLKVNENNFKTRCIITFKHLIRIPKNLSNIFLKCKQTLPLVFASVGSAVSLEYFTTISMQIELRRS